MPALPLNEVVRQAQDAFDGGDYQGAIDTCRRLLDQYPEFVTAHRLLGQAYLEQQAVDEAERAFQETLRRDPQDLHAYVGLGTVAEGRNDADTALAYLQAAWEIAPERTDLRDHVVRLSQEIYGSDGRLQLTRAGLGSLHYRAGRWGRAVHECAAVLAEYPTRIDVRLRLAEALWRRGEQARAAATCRAILEQTSDSVVALLILADIEHRQGHEAEATALRDRARAADPDGGRAATLIPPTAGEQADFLLQAEMPVLEERDAQSLEPERPRIAPAPDFMDPTPTSKPVSSVADEAAQPADAIDISLPSDHELEAARPSEPDAAGYTGLLRSLEGEGIEPFSAADFDAAGAQLSSPASEEAEPETPMESAAQAQPESSAAAARPATPDERQLPEVPAAEHAGTGTDTDSEMEDLEALFAMPSDQEIEAARPADIDPRGHTGLLRSLEDSGIEPFTVADAPVGDEESASVAESAVDESIVDEQPTPSEQVASSEPAVEDAASDAAAVTPVSNDWDAIDDEIRNAIPGDLPRGYTDELRSLDASGVEPFSFEDDEIPFFQRSRQPEVSAEAEQAPAPIDETLQPFSIDDIPPATDPQDDLDRLAELDRLELEQMEAAESSSVAESEPFVTNQRQDAAAALEGAGPPDQADVVESQAPAVDQGNAEELFADIEAAHEQAMSDWSAQTSLDEASGTTEPLDLSEAEPVDEQVTWEQPAADSQPAVEWPPAAEPEWSERPGEPQEAEPAETAAAETPAWKAGQPERPEIVEHGEHAEQAGHVDSPAGESAYRRLGVDTELFERARAAKAEMVDAGLIQGERPLGEAAESAPTPAEAMPSGEMAVEEPADVRDPEPIEPSVEVEQPAPSEPSVGMTPGASLDELRETVRQRPDDLAAHLTLASGLVEAGRGRAALEEYYWAQRHSGGQPDGESQLVAGLQRLAATDAETAPAAHRLLGALYRKRGDVYLASHHYALSLGQGRGRRAESGERRA